MQEYESTAHGGLAPLNKKPNLIRAAPTGVRVNGSIDTYSQNPRTFVMVPGVVVEHTHGECGNRRM